ncbi:MAG: hypothetical protein IJB82_00705 [Bacilli bacterium]|nr:hypothetical protein [Bacilli bacterium]
MQNRFLSNKEILKYAKNYYKIINEEYYEGDNISYKLIEIYREYLLSIKSLTQNIISKIEKVDNIINKYFDDFEFKKELSKGITKLKIKKDGSNILEQVIDNFILIYDKYVESYTRNIYIPRWI